MTHIFMNKEHILTDINNQVNKDDTLTDINQVITLTLIFFNI